jgi:hypothetical protein
MLPFIQVDEDPDFDIIQERNKIAIYVDLRGKGLNIDNVAIKLNSNSIYIVDPLSNSIVKNINLLNNTNFRILEVRKNNGTLLIILEKSN